MSNFCDIFCDIDHIFVEGGLQTKQPINDILRMQGSYYKQHTKELTYLFIKIVEQLLGVVVSVGTFVSKRSVSSGEADPSISVLLNITALDNCRIAQSIRDS